MSISHNIASYVKQKFEQEQFKDLTYYMCFEGESIFPVHYTYADHPLYEHWKVLAYAANNTIYESIEDKACTHIFASSSLRCPPVNLPAEEIVTIQKEAQEWAEAQGEDTQAHEYEKMKDYIVVEGFNGEEFETLAMEIKGEEIGEIFEFNNPLAKEVGWLPHLGHELIRSWLKAQDNYDELLEEYAKKGRVRLTASEFEKMFPDGVVTGAETEEVIVVEEESDHEN